MPVKNKSKKKIMKTISKVQLDRLLGGYLYYIYKKELREDDPVYYSRPVPFEWISQYGHEAANHNSGVHDYNYSCIGEDRGTVFDDAKIEPWTLDTKFDFLVNDMEHVIPEQPQDPPDWTDSEYDDDTDLDGDTGDEESSIYIIRFSRKEASLDIGELQIAVTPNEVSATLYRMIRGIRKLYCHTEPFMGAELLHHPELERLQDAVNDKMRDELVWSDIGAGFDKDMIKKVIVDYDVRTYKCDYDDGLIITMDMEGVFDSSEFPKLSQMNKALDGLEGLIWDYLG